MEENNQSSLFELAIDHESSSYLTETARWAKFLSIAGFITCGLLAVASFFIGSILSRNTLSPYGADGVRAGAYSAGLSAGITAVYLAIAVLYFFPCLHLYRFAVRLKAALRDNDQVQLNLSLKSQKSLFRFVGILTLVVLAFYALAIIAVGITSVFTHSVRA